MPLSQSFICSFLPSSIHVVLFTSGWADISSSPLWRPAHRFSNTGQSQGQLSKNNMQKSRFPSISPTMKTKLLSLRFKTLHNLAHSYLSISLIFLCFPYFPLWTMGLLTRSQHTIASPSLSLHLLTSHIPKVPSSHFDAILLARQKHLKSLSKLCLLHVHVILL